MRTLPRLLVAALLAIGASTAVLAAPAAAADITPQATTCDNKGQKWFSWSSISQPNTVTHLRGIENWGNVDLNQDYRVWWEITVGAEYTASGSVTVSGSIVVASLDAQVSASLKVYGSKTWGEDITMRITVPAGHVVVGYSGTKVVTGSYKYYYCNTSGLLYVTTGTGKSYISPVTGVVDCANYPPSGSLGYVAKNKGC